MPVLAVTPIVLSSDEDDFLAAKMLFGSRSSNEAGTASGTELLPYGGLIDLFQECGHFGVDRLKR
ncbi:MAG: hypothetical protein MZW92_12925 [Comamonadaceae bacterium]|nr:hypothetical protein [Comamonadaceae bacterium]